MCGDGGWWCVVMVDGGVWWGWMVVCGDGGWWCVVGVDGGVW